MGLDTVFGGYSCEGYSYRCLGIHVRGSVFRRFAIPVESGDLFDVSSPIAKASSAKAISYLGVG